jgi:CheY-like chemotaxis protein
MKRVLLIDDDAGFTRLLRLNLERTGRYEVGEVNVPGRALAVAREFAPDAIVLDFAMPDPDGPTLAAELRDDDRLRDVPILFLTAWAARPTVLPPSLGMGPRTYLPKPVDLRHLLAWLGGDGACVPRDRNRPRTSAPAQTIRPPDR